MTSLSLGSSPAREPMSERGIEMAPWAWLAAYDSLGRAATNTAWPLASACRASAAEIRRADSWVGAVWVTAGAAAGGCGAANAEDAATASSAPPANARPLRDIQCILEPPGQQTLAGGPSIRPILQPGPAYRPVVNAIASSVCCSMTCALPEPVEGL